MSVCPRCEVDNRLGYEYRETYDGVLIWGCQSCGHAWPRFPAHPSSTRLHEKAVEIISGWDAPPE